MVFGDLEERNLVSGPYPLRRIDCTILIVPFPALLWERISRADVRKMGTRMVQDVVILFSAALVLREGRKKATKRGKG